MLCSFCLLTSWLASWSHCHTWGRRKCRGIFQREDVKWLIEPSRSGSLSPMLAGNKSKEGRHRQRGQGPRKAVSCRCVSTSQGVSRKGGWMTAKRSFTALHLDFFVLQRHARACISLLSKGPSFVVAGAAGIQNSWSSIKLGACREPPGGRKPNPCLSHLLHQLYDAAATEMFLKSFWVFIFFQERSFNIGGNVEQDREENKNNF